jgi:hypothetical protein
MDDLGLDADTVKMLKLRKQTKFDAIEQYCNINCIRKKQLDGGSIQYGWVIWQDRMAGLTEAEFHTVWVDDNGEYHDITPRKDNEKRIMFVPDKTRVLIVHKDSIGVNVNSFTNHKMLNGVIVERTTNRKVYLEPDKLARIGAKL